MKAKSIIILIGFLILGWNLLFQGTQTASSSSLLRITFTPSPTVTQPVPTLPPPPIITNPPLIPVTGLDMGDGNVDVLVVGGLVLLVLGVVGLAWPEKRTTRSK